MNSEILPSEIRRHGCCQKNKLSICLCILLLLSLLVVVILAFLFLNIVHFEATSEEECTSLACIQSASEISQFLDESIDPCDDFYQFVCSKFLKTSYEKQINNPIDGERSRIKRHLESYITEPISEDDPQPVKLQKSYFRACLNVDEIDADNGRTFFKKLNEISDWPILHKQNWDDERFDWIKIVIKARNFGLPFEWFLKLDLHEEDEHYTFKLTHPTDCGAKLSEEYLLMRREILEQLTTPVIDTILELRNLTDFEEKLHSICANIEDFGLDLEKVANIPWETFSMNYFLSAITGQRWRSNTEVAIEKNYLVQLNRLLKETPKMVQANYILWKIIEYFAPYLAKPIRETYAQYMNEDVSRFDFCLQDTKSKFKYISEVTDLKNYDQNELQETGDQLAESITTMLLTTIENINWKNNKTKESHLDLYENIEVLVGGPEEMFEDSFLNKHTHIGKTIFLSKNIIQMLVDWSESVLNYKSRMIGKRATKSFELAYEANAQFVVVLDEDEQQLILPSSILDSFLYKTDAPEYLNFAGLGTIVGTELMKGFHFLNRGRYESFINFEENKRCLIENLQKSNRNINSSLIFFKNYESLLGQDLTYRAYQKYVEDTEEEMKLVNLPYTPNQLFWIKSNLNWCYHALPNEESPLNLEEILKYRIIENVKNSPFFGEDFNCASDSPMNPKNKCSLL